MLFIIYHSDCAATTVTGGAGVVQTAFQSTATLVCDAEYTMYNTGTSAIIPANTFTFYCNATAVWDTDPTTLECQQGILLQLKCRSSFLFQTALLLL